MSVDLIVDSTRKQSSQFRVDSQTDLTLGIDLKVDLWYAVDSLRVEYEYFNKSTKYNAFSLFYFIFLFR